MKIVHDISWKELSNKEKWVIINQHTKMLYYTRAFPNWEDANKEAIKKFCDYEEIARIASLFDVVF